MPRRGCLSLELLFNTAEADLAAGVVRNPADKDIDEALERLGYNTSERRWVKQYYGRIYFALANRVGCLDYLEGVHGTATGVSGDDADAAREAQNRVIYYFYRTYPETSLRSLDWAGGKARLSTKGKLREVRLGKLLKQVGAPADLIKAFETRGVALEWRITADPREVASMSYGRAWTSCMRPGGMHELGPLSDVMAGSALLLFFRPGSDEPCGREILRPSWINDVPIITRSGKTYGTAAQISDDALQEAFFEQTGVGDEHWPQVDTGQLDDVYGIFFNVYDDYTRRSYEDGSEDDFAQAAVGLRHVWQEYVKLAETDVSGMTEEHFEVGSTEEEREEAKETARFILSTWHDNDYESIGLPADPRRPPSLRGTGMEHLDEDLWAEAWEEVVEAAPITYAVVGHGRSPLNTPSDRAKYPQLTYIGVEEIDFDPDDVRSEYTYKNHPTIIKAYKRLLNREESPWLVHVQIGTSALNNCSRQELENWMNKDGAVEAFALLRRG